MKALDSCLLERFQLLPQPPCHSLLDLILTVEPPPRQRGLLLKKEKVVTGGQVRTIGWMIKLLKATAPQSSLGKAGFMNQSVVVEEDNTKGQLVLPLLIDRVSND